MKIINTILLTFIVFLFSSFSVFSQNNVAHYIKVTSPNGGEKWEANTTQTITWQSSGIYKVKIEFSFNYGYSWHVIATTVDASQGRYSWILPNSQTSGVLIKISDASNALLYDISDKTFNLYIQRTNKKSKNLSKTSGVPNKTTALTTSDSVKIWPLGDSITDGEGDDPLFDQTIDGYIAIVGWREKLFNLLKNAGYKFRFVGTRISGYDDIAASLPSDSRVTSDFYIKGRYNDGHGGWVADGPTRSIAATVPGWLDTLKNIQSRQNDPNVTLCMAGTNDYWGDTDTQVRDHIQNILNNINTFNSNIRTIFATVIYYHHESRFSLSEQNNLNNNLLPSLATNLINLHRNVSLVNMYSVLPKSTYPSDFSDSVTVTPGDELFNDVHPNGTGYTLMANAWFTALQNYLPVLNLRVFLQGPYAGSGAMTTSLRSFFNGTTNVDLLPTTSPYSDSKTVSYAIPDSVTDWIFLEIRNSSNIVIKSKSCFLSDHGYVIDPDGFSTNISLGIPPGNYYVVVKHRNHLAVMSADLVQLNGLTSYDFTTDSTQAYGTGKKPVAYLGSGKYGMWAGDVNGDGVVKYNLTSNDRALIYSRIGGGNVNATVSGYYNEDVNLDGIVKYNLSNNDRALIYQNIGGGNVNATLSTQVPP